MWLQCQDSAVSETTKLQTHVRMCSHPTSDSCKSLTIGSPATHQILAQLATRILRHGDGGARAHVQRCPPHPWLVESTYLVTHNPHTKFEHNRPSRSRDTEVRSARAHVQRYPTHDLWKALRYGLEKPTHQNWTQLAKPFLRYRSAVCTCARAEIPHPWLLHKL